MKVGKLVTLCALLASCTTQRIKESSQKSVTTRDTLIETLIRHDTVRSIVQQQDSVTIRDSVYVTERQRGDTVFLTTYKEATRYRERVVHDTAYKHIFTKDTVYIVRADTVLSKHTEARTRSPTTKYKLLFMAIIVVCICVIAERVRQRKRAQHKG